MLFSKTKSYLGVDIGAFGIKIVELRKEKNRPVLFTYGYSSASMDVHQLLEPAPGVTAKPARNESGQVSDERAKRYTETIMEICRQAKAVSKVAVVSLPVSAVFHVVITLPAVKKEDFNIALRAEIKKLLPRPVEEMALDYQILPGANTDENQRVLVNAVPRELVDFYSKIFQKAGLILDSLEPESTALCRSLIGKDSAVSMLIDMGAERTNFFIADQGMPITHHSIESGGNRIKEILKNILGVDSAASEQMKADFSRYLVSKAVSGGIDNGFFDAFVPVIDPIVKEIEYSTDLFSHQGGNEGKRLEKVILSGGASFLPFLPQFIGDKFKIKCYVGDPWSRVVCQEGLKPLLHQIGPRMAVAIGLAMRNMV